MIVFQLKCQDEHTFEAWFRDSQACDLQSSVGLVECPYCGSTKISKTPVALQGTKPNAQANDDETDVRAHEVAQQILDAVGKLQNFAEENFENVGVRKADGEEFND